MYLILLKEHDNLQVVASEAQDLEGVQAEVEALGESLKKHFEDRFSSLGRTYSSSYWSNSFSKDEYIVEASDDFDDTDHTVRITYAQPKTVSEILEEL